MQRSVLMPNLTLQTDSTVHEFNIGWPSAIQEPLFCFALIITPLAFCLLLFEICLMLHQVKNMAEKPNVSEKTGQVWL
ncbi:hypothetical protein ACI65C_012074 [Semiaphis heraclei]